MGLLDKLKTGGDWIGADLMAQTYGLDWREKMKQAQLENERTRAQTGLLGVQTRGAEADIERARAGTATEGLRQQQLQRELEQNAAEQAELKRLAESGQIPASTAAAQKAILDTQKMDIDKRVAEANITQSNAAAAYSRAGARRLDDPTRRALETQALLDVHRQRRAQTRAAEALTDVRERPPVRQPSEIDKQRAMDYARRLIQSELEPGLFGFGGGEGKLKKGTREYEERLGQLEQEYYSIHPQTAGGLSATIDLPQMNVQGYRDGKYTDPNNPGLVIVVQGGQVIRTEPAPAAGAPSVTPMQPRTGLGTPGLPPGMEEPEVEY